MTSDEFYFEAYDQVQALKVFAAKAKTNLNTPQQRLDYLGVIKMINKLEQLIDQFADIPDPEPNPIQLAA